MKITWQVVWDYRTESIKIHRSRQENRDRRFPTSTCLRLIERISRQSTVNAS